MRYPGCYEERIQAFEFNGEGGDQHFEGSREVDAGDRDGA